MVTLPPPAAALLDPQRPDALESFAERAVETFKSLISRGEEPRFAVDAIEGLSGGFTREEIEAIVVPKRTLARRLAKKEPLTVEETDRALRLARIGAQAERVFGNPEKAGRWLRKPSPALAGQTPIAMLRSETGAQLVAELLGQIAHGMFV
ncbi:antitoxin Xre/MbcA/ParS toxin-binding domain-containing protein [Methylosinus sp. PW1]|uniref:type II RES/Xre toxin-antitoxin system antitoxin n=1 Tax=Methylosinus sp. PW1 TaxID=107636 RepID=UPI0009FDF190|nr:antitoxin Xre/MbcA/ParS toxin-binding domain-containing protein [Methylosinus sp. PW1]